MTDQDDGAEGFNRYAGKPFLLWVDSFILKAIGHLDPVMEAKLEAATPKLRESFGAEGSWEDIVMEQLDYTGGVRDSLRALWADNQAAAAAAGGELMPMQFVEVFVAENIMPPSD